MTQKEKVELFLNWLMDNNYFSKYCNQLTIQYNIRHNGYSGLLNKLNETNYQDFVDILMNDKEQKKDFDLQMMVLDWKSFYEGNEVLKTKIDFVKGDYICYVLDSYGVRTEYVSIVKSCEDNYIEECCSVIRKSEDEELIDNISFNEGFDICDKIKHLRKATDEEKKWLDDFLLEDGVKINELIG